MKVAVIGAGAAGLVATKRLTEPNSGFECCTFEQTNNIGGQWVYTNDVGFDEYGIPIHTSMYQGLRTNLPKEIMELPDYRYRNLENNSFISSGDVLKYLEEYAEYFNLKQFIKLHHHVTNVKPHENGQWKIYVTDLKQRQKYEHIFDAVFVCNGHEHKPKYPQIDGIENFKGFKIHSHEYRKPLVFESMEVVVIGAGPSGWDIVEQISQTANKVYWSHHNNTIKIEDFTDNVIKKSDVSKIKCENIFEFEDGSEVKADAVLYCTGYEYNFSFLCVDCNIKVENNVVTPLYHQFINIEYPTMSFIGIPGLCPVFSVFDLQVLSTLKIWKQEVTLPSKHEMYAQMGADIEERCKVTGNRKYYHTLNEDAKKYFDTVAEFSGVPKIMPVIFDIYSNTTARRKEHLPKYRSDSYKIIDHKQFKVEIL